jgi:hypothetical protein
MRLLRTVRLDPSDILKFECAAEPGEWAVSGSFLFMSKDIAKLDAKTRTAFHSGFLGIRSFGWSTLVEIVEACESDYVAGVEKLAKQLVMHLGAPTSMEAEIPAEAEFAFGNALCGHTAGTWLAVERAEHSGKIRETFTVCARQKEASPFSPLLSWRSKATKTVRHGSRGQLCG